MAGLIVVPKYTWQRITMALPSNSPYFRHDKCGTGCTYPNGSQLSAAVVKHICLILADAVGEHDPESRAYRGVAVIASAASRNRRTVMAALGHLQTAGLIDRTRLGGGLNVAKGAPSAYSLTIPRDDAELLLQLARVDTDMLRRIEELLQQTPGQDAWTWFPAGPEHVS